MIINVIWKNFLCDKWMRVTMSQSYYKRKEGIFVSTKGFFFYPNMSFKWASCSLGYLIVTYSLAFIILSNKVFLLNSSPNNQRTISSIEFNWDIELLIEWRFLSFAILEMNSCFIATDILHKKYFPLQEEKEKCLVPEVHVAAIYPVSEVLLRLLLLAKKLRKFWEHFQDLQQANKYIIHA